MQSTAPPRRCVGSWATSSDAAGTAARATESGTDVIFLLPVMTLCGLGLTATLAGVWTSRRGAAVFALGGFFVCLFGMGIALWLMGYAAELGPDGVKQILPRYVAYTFAIDPLSMFFATLALGVCALSMLFSMDYVEHVLEEHHCEFLALIAFASMGVACVAAARDFITVFFSLELVSITGYLLAGMLRRDDRSVEAALKYFLLGAISSAVMLFGMSLVYGLAGTTDLLSIRMALGNEVVGGDALTQGRIAVGSIPVAHPMLITGVLAIVVGLGFKVAMVPFHQWCPDTYEGAPTPVTAFLSIGPKAAGFAAIIRVLVFAFGGDAESAPWYNVVIGLCAATMTLGNVVACRQTNIKRMLAYSSIAHSGYILIAVVALKSAEFAIPAILAYLVVYVLMNAGAFSVVIAFSNVERSDDLEAYNGLMKRSPYLAVSWVIFAMSLAGLPPAAGFLGKLYVFSAALDINVRLYWLAVVGVVNAVISAWYYFRVTHHMFFCQPRTERPIHVQPGVGLAIALSLAGTLILVPAFPALFSFIQDAARMLGAW